MDPLELSYDNESDIPDGFAALYKASGGKWVLAHIKGLKTDKDVAAVKTVADKERKLRAEVESKLKKYEKLGDHDPEELLKIIDEATELRAKVEASGAGDDKARQEAQQKLVDAAVARALGPVQRELKTAQAENAKLKGDVEAEGGKVTLLRGTIKQSAIKQALTKAALDTKVRDTAIGDVLMHAQVFEAEENENGEIIAIKTRDGVGVTPGLDVAGWLADRKGDKTHWWESSVGGGAQGGKGGVGGGADNPFNPKNPNMTAASKMVMTDPARATRLAQAAGFETPEAAFAAAAKADASLTR